MFVPVGRVRWFNDSKGYGFIQQDGGEEDIFVHFSDIQTQGYRSLRQGQIVQFDIKETSKGLRASNVRIVGEEDSQKLSF